MEKTVMLQMMGRIYVGNPVYEIVEVEDGHDANVMTEMKDAYEFIPIATLIPDNRGNMGVLSTFAVLKVGTIVLIPDDAMIAELANDSTYYKEYVKVTTGINVAGAGELPSMPVKRERGIH